MIILTIFLSFIMFVLTLVIGVTIGYSMGNKNDKTLKQQIGRLKQTVKSQNKSAQLKELTTEELKLRDDWDFRSKMAEITGQDPTTPDTRVDNDPNSMENMF